MHVFAVAPSPCHPIHRSRFETPAAAAAAVRRSIHIRQAVPASTPETGWGTTDNPVRPLDDWTRPQSALAAVFKGRIVRPWKIVLHYINSFFSIASSSSSQQLRYTTLQRFHARIPHPSSSICTHLYNSRVFHYACASPDVVFASIWSLSDLVFDRLF